MGRGTSGRGRRGGPRILVVHGPNLNLLGTRRPEVYGHRTLAEIDDLLQAAAEREGTALTTIQLNGEGDIVTRIQEARGHFDGLVINPGAYTHTSIAIRDAIEAAELPAVEVHLSNIYAREEFRRYSFVAGVCLGQIAGFGANSYLLALNALTQHLRETSRRFER